MSETFVAIVGQNKKKFMLYTAVATRSSEFFRAASRRDWKESREKEVALPEINASDFEGYLQWLNTGEVTFSGEPSLFAITRLYVVGDFLEDAAFRDAILDCIVERACEKRVYPDWDTIQLAWEQTRRGNPMQRLYLSIWASMSTKKRIDNLNKSDARCSKEFVIDFFQHIVAARRLDKPSLGTQDRNDMIRRCRRDIAEQQTDETGR